MGHTEEPGGVQAQRSHFTGSSWWAKTDCKPAKKKGSFLRLDGVKNKFGGKERGKSCGEGYLTGGEGGVSTCGVHVKQHKTKKQLKK